MIIESQRLCNWRASAGVARASLATRKVLLIGAAMRHAIHAAADDEQLLAMGYVYLRFAAEHPAVYAAMFELPTDIPFAQPNTPAPALAGFDALRTVVAGRVVTTDVETATELFWSGLHGLATLQHANRLRPELQSERLKLLIDNFTRG